MSSNVGNTDNFGKPVSFSQYNMMAVKANTQGPTLLPGQFISQILYAETAGHNLTGNLNIGTSSTGTQIVNGQTVTANQTNHIADSAITQRVVSASTPIYLSSSNWNSASLNVTFIIGQL